METFTQKVARLSGGNPNVMVLNIEPVTHIQKADYSKLSISELAGIIAKDWRKQSATGVHPYAKPYHEAMYALTSIKDNYGADTGSSIVAYFIANASQWKGDTSKAVKAELNKRLKQR